MQQLKLVGLFDDMNTENNSKFYKYHENHPEVYKLFVKKTLEAIKKGFKHFGSKGIFEQIRWENGGEVKKDGYKLNNLYTPYYSRLFEKDHPEHKGFFRMRKVKSELV